MAAKTKAKAKPVTKSVKTSKTAPKVARAKTAKK